MKGLFPRYADKTLDQFQILHPTHEEAIGKVKEYIDTLPDMRYFGHGLTILGPQGVGKTFLAEMVLKAAQEQERHYSVESIEASTYTQLHQDLMHIDKQEEYEEYDGVRRHIARIQQGMDFVLFDDIGREHVGATDWSSHLLYNAMRYRYNRLKPCLFTSNLNLDALTERYTLSFTSVLHENTDIIVLKGEDIRCREDN